MAQMRRCWRARGLFVLAVVFTVFSLLLPASASPTRFIESLRVYATGQQALSTYATTNGLTYEIVVSGWFASRVIPPGYQDVRYVSEDNWASWGHVWEDSEWRGTVLRWSEAGTLSVPTWGDYSPSHVYATQYVGLGDNISFFIYDNYYGDNSGWLTADIYEVVPEPLSLLALACGLGSVLFTLCRRNETRPDQQ
jgi:hypothetical protein